MRLQVFLSHNGVSSRRGALELIFEGHVRVNGRKICEPSTAIDPKQDRVEVDGRLVQSRSCRYILLNKPAGYVTTKKDPFAFQTVFDLLPEECMALVPVGRLDKDTEGLLLLTNDGDLNFQLTHPKFGIQKVYFVRIQGKLPTRHVPILEQGMILKGRKTAPAHVSQIRFRDKDTELFLTISEGRKRQIRLMFAELGFPVVYLKRVALGSLRLGDLAVSRWRELEEKEIEALKKSTHL